MGSKGGQPDHAGLQSVPTHDAPEVIHESQLPSSVQRHSSVNSPEAYTPIKGEKPRYEYYGGTPEVRAHYGERPEGVGDTDKEVNEPSSQRRICGLRRVTFFWTLAVVVLVIVIAVVLGGVLGSVLGRSHSKP